MELFLIIDVINFNLEIVSNFEVILTLDFGNPLRIEIVMDDLGLAEFLPHVTLLLAEDQERIRLGKRVQVRQVLARKRQG